MGINLWGDWEMKPEYGPEPAKRSRGESEPKFVVGERPGRGDRGGMDLDKLSEMERRMGLGGGGGGRGRDGWR